MTESQMDPEREQAVRQVLVELRSPLLSMSKPAREEVIALCLRFDITVVELIEYQVNRARNT